MTASALERLEALAAEHALEVELQHVPAGESRGWYAAAYGQSSAGLGTGKTLVEAFRGALSTASRPD